MAAPRVRVGSLGGTIAMTSGAAGKGVTPTLTAADLVAAVPVLAEVAELEAHTLRNEPSAWFGPAEVLEALAWARGAAEDADGVVLVQGTDTIEETSYLLDLHFDATQPLVVTGAMRSPALPGADGPANLVASAVVAGAAASRGLGVLVVLDDDVHAASRVRKSDSTSTSAFSSAPHGALGRVHERTVTYVNRPSRWPALPAPLPGREPRVALLETHLGDDGALLRTVVEAGYDGVVLAAFGVGHVSTGLAAAVSEAVTRCPLVLASRTGSGPVLHHTYGFVGSESDLIERGAVPAGWIDARKSRLLLWSLLAADASADTVRRTFAERGAAPGGPDHS